MKKKNELKIIQTAGYNGARMVLQIVLLVDIETFIIIGNFVAFGNFVAICLLFETIWNNPKPFEM